MFRIKKSKDAFFEAFTRHAEFSVRASGLLRQLFEEPVRSREIASEISSAEHDGDQITHQTIARLRSQWITPLDRHDIHTLITKLDDVLDMIDAIAERMVLFKIDQGSAIATDAARVLQTSVSKIQSAVMLLPDHKQRAKEILQLCVEINTLENEGDTLYRSAIATLFTPGNDPVTILKWRDIHEDLETAIDVCEDVADTLEGIVMEYA